MWSDSSHDLKAFFLFLCSLVFDVTSFPLFQQPFELDYIQVFYSLCEILIAVYQKIQLVNDQGIDTLPGYREAFAKLDGRFKVALLLSLVLENLS